MTETKTIRGVVKFFRDLPKGYAVKIGEDWFNAFSGKCPVDKETLVNLTYTEKESQGTLFRNIRTLQVVSEETPEVEQAKEAANKIFEKNSTTQEKPGIEPGSLPTTPAKERIIAFEGLTIKELAAELNKLSTIATQVFLKSDGKFDALAYLR